MQPVGYCKRRCRREHRRRCPVVSHTGLGSSYPKIRARLDGLDLPDDDGDAKEAKYLLGTGAALQLAVLIRGAGRGR